MIVGGFPRAGTRQFTDILNKHSEIMIKGECYPTSFDMLANTFEQADIEHKGKWSEKSYIKNRLRSALNAYACISKGDNQPFNFKDALVVGFKKPRIEIQYHSIEKLFNVAYPKIIFFYCVRNLKDNFLSANSTFNTSPEKFITQTNKSLIAINKIIKQSIYDSQVISLDEFIQHEDKGLWLSNNLFSKLPIGNLTKEQCQSFLDQSTNRNSTEKKGKKRKKDLSNALYQMFQNSAALKQNAMEFEMLTGKTIWNF